MEKFEYDNIDAVSINIEQTKIDTFNEINLHVHRVIKPELISMKFNMDDLYVIEIPAILEDKFKCTNKLYSDYVEHSVILYEIPEIFKNNKPALFLVYDKIKYLIYNRNDYVTQTYTYFFTDNDKAIELIIKIKHDSNNMFSASITYLPNLQDINSRHAYVYKLTDNPSKLNIIDDGEDLFIMKKWTQQEIEDTTKRIHDGISLRRTLYGHSIVLTFGTMPAGLFGPLYCIRLPQKFSMMYKDYETKYVTYDIDAKSYILTIPGLIIDSHTRKILADKVRILVFGTNATPFLIYHDFGQYDISFKRQPDYIAEVTINHPNPYEFGGIVHDIVSNEASAVDKIYELHCRTSLY